MNAECEAIMADPKWQAEKAEFDRYCAALDVAAAPFLKLKLAWYFLEFTPLAREAMGGDPDIAFQCELEGWIIRMDYSGEIGNGHCHWKCGCEAEALEAFKDDFFAHGTPTRLATEAELTEYQWALDAAVRGWVRARRFNHAS